MLVVKPTTGSADEPARQHYIDIIAGEMLNKEASLRYWHNGKALTVGVDVTPEDYNGYPKIVVGNIRQTVKASWGIIFVTEPVTDKLCDQLKDAVLRKESTMVGIEPLERYHTRSAGVHTNVKVKSQMKLTIAGTAKSTGNIRRLICMNQSDHRYSKKDPRFTWYVRHLREFNDSITSDQSDSAIANYVCSILYDIANVTSLEHGDILTNYSHKFLKASPNLISDPCPTVRIRRDLPLLTLVFDGRCNPGHLYTIPADIHSAEYDQIIPIPVKTDEDGIFSIEHCAGCRKLLYDDVYAYVDAKTNIARPECHVYCILCAHGRGALYDLADGVYTHVLRLTWPRTAKDMISHYAHPALRPVLTELCDLYIEHGIKGDDSYYVLVGKNYVGVDEIRSFKFNPLINHPDIAHRKIFEISIS